MGATNQNDTVVGVFFDEEYAQQAVQALQAAGYNARIADETAIKSFRSLGWEDEVASLYQSRYDDGNSIVVVDSGDGVAALDTLLQYGAEYINLKGSGTASGAAQTQTQATQTRSTQGEAYDAQYYSNLATDQRQYGAYDQNLGRARNQEEIKLQLREETLTPVKASQEAGQVQLRKVVHEEQVEIPVTLRREEVIIERVPVDREVSAAEAVEITDIEDQVISVPVYEETVELQKHTRVREEVTLEKRAVEEQQTLTGTARSEDVELDQSGNVRVQGTGASNVATNETRSKSQNKPAQNK